jgi:hypothetical protein
MRLLSQPRLFIFTCTTIVITFLTVFILTYAVNFPRERKPECLEKIHDFPQSVDRLFSLMSPQRESNPRPQRWKALALTTTTPEPPVTNKTKASQWHIKQTSTGHIVNNSNKKEAQLKKFTLICNFTQSTAAIYRVPYNNFYRLQYCFPWK